ncbi:MAG TPA: hypothetical protein VGC79_13385, partial [Polyangiaceae bacterium]
MKILLQKLEVVTRRTTEAVQFGPVTFLHGPVGTGKSTVARLVDYCFGGDLVWTPAIQNEFVAGRLFVTIGVHNVVLERDRASPSSVRVTWQIAPPDPGPIAAEDLAHASSEIGPNFTELATEAIAAAAEVFEDDAGEDRAPGSGPEPSSLFETTLAPLDAERGTAIVEGLEHVENLSDLIFHLAGVPPIKVRQNKRDPDAKLIRLSFRDLLFYCYLDQDGLDSSFFSFDHPFKRQKSIDAMRFVVGFHSERLNDLEQRLYRTLDQQRTKRAMAEQLGALLTELKIDSEVQIEDQLSKLIQRRSLLKEQLAGIEATRKA